MTRTSFHPFAVLCGLLVACGSAEDLGPALPEEPTGVSVPSISGLPMTEPAQVGMSSDGLNRIRPAM